MRRLESKQRYWLIVAECLKEFHGYTEHEAWRAIAMYLESLPRSKRAKFVRWRTPGAVIELRPNAQELLYHSEPYNIACDLAKRHQEHPRRTRCGTANALQRYKQLRESIRIGHSVGELVSD